MTRLQARTIFVAVLVAAILALFVLNQSGRLETAKSLLLVPLTAIQRGIASATGGLVSAFQNNPDAEALRQRNAELEAQIAQLQNQVVSLQENEAELRLISALLDYARTQPENRYLGATVIGRDTSPFLSYAIIDQGTDKGVARGMPVVTDQGLVGTVVETTCCSSKIRLITDPDSAVNARLQVSRDEGQAVGLFGGGLELQFLSQQAEVRPGDLVLTSGLGAAYPQGLVLGSVSAVQRQDYEVQQKASLTPAVDFNRLEIVLVIINFKPVDLTPLLQATAPAAAP
jgi:rod shape-determining protein MreC